MQKILVIGNSNIDLVIHSKKLPKPGETVIGNEFLKNPGGKGLIRLLQLHVIYFG